MSAQNRPRCSRAHVIDGLDRVDPALGAYLGLDPDRVLADARNARSGRFEGLRVAVKDLIDVAGYDTTLGSATFGHRPATHAAVVSALTDQGAVVMGKTNLNELAFGVTGHNPHFGPILTPHDRRRTASGSSGGSAVAVAMGSCDVAIGTDTSGSVRLPAAACGLWGFKCAGDPDRGQRIAASLEGVFPLSPSFDSLGYITRDVDTLQLVLGVRELPPFESIRVAALGHDLEVPALPEEHWTIFRHESYAVHGDAFEKTPEAFGADIQVKLARSRGDEVAARAVEATWRREFGNAAHPFDVVVGPVLDGSPPLLDDVLQDYEKGRFWVADRILRHTPIANALGWLAVAFPTSKGPQQALARPGCEAQALAVAARLSDT